MSYFLFFPSGVLRRYHWHILFSKLSMSFLLQRFSHMSLQWGNNLYMLFHFLLIFSLGLKEFLTKYVSSISHRFYPTGHFGGLMLYIDLKMDSIKRGVLQLHCWSHVGTVPTLLSLSLFEPSTLWSGCLRAHPWRPYGCVYTYQRSMKGLLVHLPLQCVPFTFSLDI